MGGVELADWLRSLDPNLKIIFSSGYTEDAISAAGMSSTGVDFLPKPYSPLALARKVREMLDS